MTVRRRLAALCAAAVLAWAVAAPAVAVVDVSGPAQGLGVAPFGLAVGGSSDGWNESPGSHPLSDVAALLAGELAARSAGRVVAPASLRRDDGASTDPHARDVRRWARWNAVENLVVGRTSGRGIAVELRSGHSGAAWAEYRLAPEARTDLPGAVGRLAALIVADLSGDTPASPVLPPVAAAPPTVATPPVDAAGARSDAGIDMALVPADRRDDPISINSEELEVLPQDGGRRLVFSRNVEVLQGDVTLRADRLEAVYPQGASQPDLLLASGHVRVTQGDRRARCDEATYERAANTILCRGKAEVLQGCDQVRGEEIEFDLQLERVRVRGAASVVIQSEAGEAGECSGPDEGGSP